MFSISLKMNFYFTREWSEKLITATLKFSGYAIECVCRQDPGSLYSVVWVKRKRPDSAALLVWLLENFQPHKHLSGSGPCAQSLGTQRVLGPLWEEWPKATIPLSLKPTGYRSPQNGELRTQTRAFRPRPSPLSYPFMRNASCSELCIWEQIKGPSTVWIRQNFFNQDCLCV